MHRAKLLGKGERLGASVLHALPRVLVIGAQKAGTTGLYRYLVQHPQFFPPRGKELHFFNQFYAAGFRFYFRHLPTVTRGNYAGFFQNRRYLTGEATPYYLFHPHVPARVAHHLPWVKLVVLLRNPVDRAYSQYQFQKMQERHNQRPYCETFEAALAAEERVFEREYQRMLADPNYVSSDHRGHSYLARGRYGEQLQRWFQFFSRDRFLILKSEDYFEQPASVYRQLTDFLELDPWQPDGFKKVYATRYEAPLAAEMRERLAAYFKPHNEALYTLLDRDFGW